MQKLLLIGLGNPGKKYVATRHNAGKMFTVWLRKEGLGGSEGLEIIETECFMNSSGDWISSFRRMRSFHAYDCLFVAHDDLDLPLGKFKIQFGRGPHDHKGLLSIYQALGTKNFWHVRIGIDNRELKVKSEKLKVIREAGETYTLKPFSREEKAILIKTFSQIQIELTKKNFNFAM